MMAFVLIYVPCLATVAVIRRETNSWKWMFFSICYSTVLAWIVAFLIYQGGRLIGLG
jgi:ferrous iron transport protein B